MLRFFIKLKRSEIQSSELSLPINLCLSNKVV